MTHLVRDLLLDEGLNKLALSAEHQIIGAWREWNLNGSLWLTVSENTALSNEEEGLVFRDVRVISIGRVLQFDLKNVLQTFLVSGQGPYRTVVVYVLPGEPV